MTFFKKKINERRWKKRERVKGIWSLYIDKLTFARYLFLLLDKTTIFFLLKLIARFENKKKAIEKFHLFFKLNLRSAISLLFGLGFFKLNN